MLNEPQRHDGHDEFIDEITGSVGSTGLNSEAEANSNVSSNLVHPANPIIPSNSPRRVRRAVVVKKRTHIKG